MRPPALRSTCRSALPCQSRGSPPTTPCLAPAGHRTVRAIVTNLGNVADSFNVSIAGTTGAVTAQPRERGRQPRSAWLARCQPRVRQPRPAGHRHRQQRRPRERHRARDVNHRQQRHRHRHHHLQRRAHLQSRRRWRRRHTAATTDGLLILRNLLQLSGNALVNGAYNPMAPTAI